MWEPNIQLFLVALIVGLGFTLGQQCIVWVFNRLQRR